MVSPITTAFSDNFRDIKYISMAHVSKESQEDKKSIQKALTDSSYSLFQFERSDVTSVLKNVIEYSFVFIKC